MANSDSTIPPEELKSALKKYENLLYARCGMQETTIRLLVGGVKRAAPVLGLSPSLEGIEGYITVLRKRGVTSTHVASTSLALERYMECIGKPIKLGRPKKKNAIIRGVLTEAEVTLLIHAAKNLRERAIISLLCYSGLRNRELCKVRIRDLDIPNQMIRIEDGKDVKDRAVCISGDCAETLYSFLKERDGQPDEFLFLTKRNKNPLACQDLRKFVRILGKRAGIKKRVHPHILRHSLATHMLNRGCHIMAIKDQLGHAHLQSTMLYVHSAQSRLKAEYQMHTPSYT